MSRLKHKNLTICMLDNFPLFFLSSADFFSKFSFSKNSFSSNNLDHDHARSGSNCLQRSAADNKFAAGRQRVKAFFIQYIYNVITHTSGPEVIKLFSCSTKYSTKFQHLIKTEIHANEEVSCFKSLRCCIYYAHKC